MTEAANAPKARTLASALMQHLRGAILRGDLAPGAKLNVFTLSKQFEVSLSPLREALARLAAEGLLLASDQRGYRVSPLTQPELEEIVLLRQTLEGLALRRAIERDDPAWRRQIRRAHDDLLDQERSRGFAVDEWEASHRRFHAALIGGAGLPLLLASCESLHDRSDRYRRMFLRNRPKDASVRDEHAAVLTAALAGEAERVVTVLQAHIGRTGANILRFLDERDRGIAARLEGN